MRGSAAAALALGFLITGHALAARVDTTDWIAEARVAWDGGHDARLLQQVRAGRGPAFEAVERLLSGGVAEDLPLARALARHYVTAFGDSSLERRILLFEGWTTAQREVRAAAIAAKGAAIQTALEGRRPEARAAFESALVVFRQLGDPMQIGRSLVNLASLETQENVGERGLVYAEEARRWLEQAGDLAALTGIEFLMAQRLVSLNDLPAARRVIDPALARARTLGDQYLEGQLLHLQAEVAQAAGRFSEAEAACLQAAKIGARIADPDIEFAGLYKLSGIHDEQGDLRRALREMQEALALAQRAGLDRRVMTALDSLCSLSRRAGDILAARRYLAAARQTAGRVDSPFLSANLVVREAEFERLDGRFAAALAKLQEGERLLEGVDAPYERATIRLGRAEVWYQRGDYARAIEEIRAGAAEAHAAHLVATEAQFHRNLGVLWSHLGDLPEALSELELGARLYDEARLAGARADCVATAGFFRFMAGDREGGRSTLRDALEGLAGEEMAWERAEALVNLAAVELQMPGSGTPATSLLREAERIYTASGDLLGLFEARLVRADAALAVGNLTGAGSVLAELRRSRVGREVERAAWRLPYLEGRVHESSGDLRRARLSLRESVAAVERLRAVVAPPAWRAAVLENRIEPYRALSRVERRLGNTAASYEAARLAKARTFIETLSPPPIDAAAVASGRVDLALAPAEVVSTAAIQARLGDDELLLDYFLDPADPVVFVVRRQALAVRSLPAVRNLEDLAAAAAYPGRPEPAEVAVLALWRAALGKLAEVLLTPARDDVRRASRLLFVPAGALHRVPFAALPLAGAGPLVESKIVSVLPAAESLLARGRATSDGDAILALGGALTADASAPQLGASAEEAGRVAALGGVGSRALVGAQASEAAFRSLAPSFAFLHLAAHGRLDRLSPGKSHIVLAADASSDGRLQADEIATLRLSARTAVLGGCETGVEAGIARGDAPGEERMGLARAFLESGVGEVVAGLWEVEDRAASTILPELYPLLHGGGVAEALSLVQRRLLRGELRGRDARSLEHPFYWAAWETFGAGVVQAPR